MEPTTPPPAATSNPAAPSGTPPPTVAASEDKTVAILSYITIFGFIAAIFLHTKNKTQLGTFHLRQCLGLIICLLPSFIPILGWIWGIFVIVMWIMGLIAAVNGQMKPVPVMGGLFQKWFSGAFN